MRAILFLFFLLISAHFSMAQNPFSSRELKEIDSLILYNHLDIAERRAEDLSRKLYLEKETEGLLETEYRQIVILDRQEESPEKSLQLLLLIKDEAEKENLPSLTYRIALMTALAYEKSKNYDLAKNYLDKAYLVYKEHHLENIFSTYCVRKSSYFRFSNELDSSLLYAQKAKEYAEKYGNETDLKDSYILLGYFANQRQNYPEALKYNFLLLTYAKQHNNSFIAVNYQNISKIYLKMQDFPKALVYSDSAYILYDSLTLRYKHYLHQTRYEIFEKLGETDSAYHYFRQYHSNLQLLQKEEETLKAKKIEEQYQNVQKETTIKTKNQQILFIICLLGVIAFGSVMLYRKNRQINRQNKIIGAQLIDLSKTLEQKQMLLSELQHRVKNNLQHVISILEIQKESVDFNNIDELIRGNQNRIHSMALLHKKLNMADNANDVDLKRYVAELAELVKESYDHHKKKISLAVQCEIENISLEKALPIGLIITELVSNSMKHAFKKRNSGIITIEISKVKNTNQLYYADNGEGFDFKQPSEKGLGQEIIKGLIDQLNGEVKSKNENGFELSITFSS